MQPFTSEPFPVGRRWVLGALRIGRRMAVMSALAHADVTHARARCRSEQRSFTAFVLAAVGRAVADHPQVHAYRDWRGRLIHHSHIDVATMIEVEDGAGTFPLAHTIRRCEERTVGDISDEIKRVATAPATGWSGNIMERYGRLAARTPGAIRLFYASAVRSKRLRAKTGTVTLTSIGSLLDGGGFAIGTPTLASLTVLVGGVSERAWVVDGAIEIREILDLAVQVDHRVTDGAPATRFGAHLRHLLEHPDELAW
jgi:pyruvate/2-oxoglutarate dehydrogenase complex dihydrolipoamide acyltransferase (E2) component